MEPLLNVCDYQPGTIFHFEFACMMCERGGNVLLLMIKLLLQRGQHFRREQLEHSPQLTLLAA
jgi:hypothetical protein